MKGNMPRNSGAEAIGSSLIRGYAEVRKHCPPIYSGLYLSAMIAQAYSRGYQEAAMGLEPSIGLVMKPIKINPGELAYTSVDGQTQLTVAQLIKELFIEAGNEGNTELEFLRKVKTAAEIMQYPVANLCGAGQERYNQLNNLIEEYEASFQSKDFQEEK